MSAFSTRAKEKPNRFDRIQKLPSNPKYKAVKPVVNTGVNVRTYLERLKHSQQYGNHRKDEIFKRIKLANFLALVIEVAREYLKFEENQDTMKDAKGDLPRLNVPPTKPISTLHSIITGVGELDLKKDLGRPNGVNGGTIRRKFSSPYLLLDVRGIEEYRQGHLVTARSYPHTLLSRSYNQENHELLTYKNAPDKIIVMYDEDETLAPRVATGFVERGYENVYILSEGLKPHDSKIPRGLVTGVLPTSCALESHSPAPRRSHFTQDDVDSMELYAANQAPSCCQASVRSARSISVLSRRSDSRISRRGGTPTSIGTTKLPLKPWK